MVSLFVGSISEYSGKNLACLGIGLKLQRDGFKVGYFRPLGVFPIRVDNKLTDEDVVFFKSTLGLTDDVAHLCPVVMTKPLIDKALLGKGKDLKGKVERAFKKVSERKDVILVGGLGDLHSGAFLGLSALSLIELLDSKVLLIDKPERPTTTVDALLTAKDEVGDRLAGVILNRVPRRQVDYFNGHVVPFLESRKIDVLGVLPEDPMLSAVTVGELRDALRAKVLCGEDRMDELVERFAVGAMSVGSALKHFRRIKNKAVITGGDRSDIQLAAMETSTTCLVLTGGLTPNAMILDRAEEAGIPVLLVEADTLTAVDRFEDLLGHLSIRNENRAMMAAKIAERNVNFKLLYKKLGLKK